MKKVTKPQTKTYSTMLFSIDRELQDKFREAVYKKEGCYRRMSGIVAKLMKEYISNGA